MATSESSAGVTQRRVLAVAYALDDVIEAAREFDDMRVFGRKRHGMILDESTHVDALVEELRRRIEYAKARAVGVGWFLRFGMARPGQFETRLRLHLETLRDACWRIDHSNQRGTRDIAVSVAEWPVDRLERASVILQAVAVPPKDEDLPPADLINHERAAEIAMCAACTIRRWLVTGKLVGYGPHRQVSESELRQRLPQIRERRSRTKKKPRRP
jgi:hypothetical protein